MLGRKMTSKDLRVGDKIHWTSRNIFYTIKSVGIDVIETDPTPILGGKKAKFTKGFVDVGLSQGFLGVIQNVKKDPSTYPIECVRRPNHLTLFR